MRYFLVLLCMILWPSALLAQNISLEESSQYIYKALQASKLAKSGSKEKSYQAVANWERKVNKEFAYIKKLQGKSISSDEEAYKKLITQAYGMKEIMRWQSEGLEVPANSAMGITCALLAVKLIYPNDPRMGISTLNGIYKHHAVATNLYEDSDQHLKGFIQIANDLL